LLFSAKGDEDVGDGDDDGPRMKPTHSRGCAVKTNAPYMCFNDWQGQG